MKNIILLALTALIMVGCNPDYNPRVTPLYGYYLTTIDSCEYIYSSNTMAHKGNCRFCKERDSIKWENHKKELEELVIKLKGK